MALELNDEGKSKRLAITSVTPARCNTSSPTCNCQSMLIAEQTCGLLPGTILREEPSHLHCE